MKCVWVEQAKINEAGDALEYVKLILASGVINSNYGVWRNVFMGDS